MNTFDTVRLMLIIPANFTKISNIFRERILKRHCFDTFYGLNEQSSVFLRHVGSHCWTEWKTQFGKTSFCRVTRYAIYWHFLNGLKFVDRTFWKWNNRYRSFSRTKLYFLLRNHKDLTIRPKLDLISKLKKITSNTQWIMQWNIFDDFIKTLSVYLVYSRFVFSFYK